MRKLLNLCWRTIVWILTLMWDMVYAACSYVVRSFLGFFAGLLHKALFGVAVVGMIVYTPQLIDVVYRWDLWLLGSVDFLPGVGWVVAKTSTLLSWLSTTVALVHMDAVWAQRLKAAVLVPWTPPGWMFLAELYILVGILLNIPSFLIERHRTKRTNDLHDELKQARADLEKWRPRDGEILPPTDPRRRVSGETPHFPLLH